MSRAPRVRTGTDQISELTTARLSVYLRCARGARGAGVNTISSKGLAEQFQLNAAQIRKDLAYFGEFGVRGVGYYVKDLRRHLREILGLHRSIKVVIIGAGNLGLALADYPGFRQDGFDIVALFDTAREKVGQYSRGGVPIRHARELDRLVEREKHRHRRHRRAGRLARRGRGLGRRRPGIARSSTSRPAPCACREGVKLKNVDLTVSLESLSFFLARGVDVPDLS